MNSETNTFENAELTTSARNIDRFSKSIISIYNSKVSDSSGRKLGRRWRREAKAITKCYAFHANAIRERKKLSMEQEQSMA